MVARIICGCPFYGAKSGQARGPAPTVHPVVGATTGGCPYYLSLPVLFVVTRIMVPNQGRHGGLPIRSTPHRGTPLWLPVLFVVAGIICGCPFVCGCRYYGAKSGQARGPAPTVHPAVGATPCGCRYYLWLPVLWCQIRAGTGACPYGPPRRWGNHRRLPVLYCQIRAGTGACPYGPPRRWGNHRGLPVLFVVLRNQGRHGGLPLRSTPRRGNPLWLPVCLWLPVLWCQIRAGTGACPYGPPRRWGNPLWLPVLFVVARLPVVARFILPNQGRHGGLPLRSTPCRGNHRGLPVLWCQIRAGTGACPYGPPRRRGNHRGLPVLFVVARFVCGCPFICGCPYCSSLPVFMVPNQGRHGGLPLRSTPRWGNHRGLPVLLGQPPVVARFVCRYPYYGAKSGQARGPAPTVHPVVWATPCGCPYCLSLLSWRHEQHLHAS